MLLAVPAPRSHTPRKHRGGRSPQQQQRSVDDAQTRVAHVARAAMRTVSRTQHARFALCITAAAAVAPRAPSPSLPPSHAQPGPAPQPQPTATATATATAHGRTGSLLPQRGTRTSASATGPWIKEHLPAAAASPLVCTDPRRRSRSAFKDYVIVLNGARPQTYACSCLGITSRVATRPCTHRSSTVAHARTHTHRHTHFLAQTQIRAPTRGKRRPRPPALAARPAPLAASPPPLASPPLQRPAGSARVAQPRA